uniref:Protein kinase domain-containing protein n=1 Tax=Panagrolaimus sp. PS1159 TaxID=55785 RepID=A0AC35GSM7_9BILA
QLDEAEGAGIFRQLCGAVYCLHHTLSVVRWYENNDIKLADFGFARYISLAQTSTPFYGTKPYSAAQLVQQKPYNPYAADCCVSGVVLHTMLCEKWPHDPNTKYCNPIARELINYNRRIPGKTEAVKAAAGVRHRNSFAGAGTPSIVSHSATFASIPLSRPASIASASGFASLRSQDVNSAF